MGLPNIQWLKQARYDLDTAEFLLGGDRCFYAVFMCHLSVEKALKGLYQEKRGSVPPRTHSLVYLLSEAGVSPPRDLGRFLVKLSGAQVATRYPASLEALERDYTRAVAAEVLARTREALEWIEAQF